MWEVREGWNQGLQGVLSQKSKNQINLSHRKLQSRRNGKHSQPLSVKAIVHVGVKTGGEDESLHKEQLELQISSLTPQG